MPDYFAEGDQPKAHDTIPVSLQKINSLLVERYPATPANPWFNEGNVPESDDEIPDSLKKINWILNYNA